MNRLQNQKNRSRRHKSPKNRRRHKSLKNRRRRRCGNLRNRNCFQNCTSRVGCLGSSAERAPRPRGRKTAQTFALKRGIKGLVYYHFQSGSRKKKIKETGIHGIHCSLIRTLQTKNPILTFFSFKVMTQSNTGRLSFVIACRALAECYDVSCPPSLYMLYFCRDDRLSSPSLPSWNQKQNSRICRDFLATCDVDFFFLCVYLSHLLL